MAQVLGASWTKTLADVAGYWGALDVWEGSYGWIVEEHWTEDWVLREPLICG